MASKTLKSHPVCCPGILILDVFPNLYAIKFCIPQAKLTNWQEATSVIHLFQTFT